MLIDTSTDTSAQPEPEYPSGADHESIGTYATFEVAREAARNSLSRGSKKEYKYYKEGTTNDGPLESEGETDVEDEPHDDDDEERDRENFCIYTYHDYGKSGHVYAYVVPSNRQHITHWRHL